ncbi:MAG: hypothetical protein LQ342_001859 [Letrouitia transgressa]|nr:MAG: hypothetical protein LQ342_001859 [Letrouitia transgressa]
MSQNTQLWHDHPIQRWKDTISVNQLKAIIQLLNPATKIQETLSRDELFDSATTLVGSLTSTVNAYLLRQFFAVNPNEVPGNPRSPTSQIAYAANAPVSSRTRSSPTSSSIQLPGIESPTATRRTWLNDPLPSSAALVRALPEPGSSLKGTAAAHSYTVTGDSVPTNEHVLLAISVMACLWKSYKWEIPLDEGCHKLFPTPPTAAEWLGAIKIDGTSILLDLIETNRLSRVTLLSISFRNSNMAASLSFGGRVFPLRGRGPVWDKQSCAVDCCIVAGRLLNVGFTIADRGNATRPDWIQTLKHEEREYLKCIASDWESLGVQASKQHRNDFWTNGLHLRIGELTHATRIWNTCVQNMGQFCFSEVDAVSECQNCGRPAPPQHIKKQTFVSLDLNAHHGESLKQRPGERLSLAMALEQYFGSTSRRCGACKDREGRTKRVQVIGKLPSRLTVQPGGQFGKMVVGTTSDKITFSYLSTMGESKATYRWLGGIYFLETMKHFRIYWVDDHSGDQNKVLKIYDGLDLLGCMYGRVPPHNGDEENCVPPQWAAGATILFYERMNCDALMKSREELCKFIDTKIPSVLEQICLGSSKRNFDEESPEPTDVDIHSKSQHSTQHKHQNLTSNENDNEDSARRIETTEAKDGDHESNRSPSFNSLFEDDLNRPRNDQDIAEDAANWEVDNDKWLHVGLDENEQGQTEQNEDEDKQGEDKQSEDEQGEDEPDEDEQGGDDEGEDEQNEEDHDEDHDGSQMKPSDHKDDKPDSESDEGGFTGGPPAAPDNDGSADQGDESPKRPKTPPPNSTPPQSPKSTSTPKTRGTLLSRFLPTSLFGFMLPSPPPSPKESAKRQTRAPSPPISPKMPAQEKRFEPFVQEPFKESVSEARPQRTALSSTSSPPHLRRTTPSPTPSPTHRETSHYVEVVIPPTPTITSFVKNVKTRNQRTVKTNELPKPTKPQRASSRIQKLYTSSTTRIPQMTPKNLRTAGSMGPFKALPAGRKALPGLRSSAAAAGVSVERQGRSLMVSSVSTGLKRSSSASSTGSSVASGGGRKRIRFT